MNSIFNAINRLITRVGDVAAYLIVIIMACVAYEVIARYGFNSPTSWVWLVNKQLFGVFIMAGGGYALVHRCHIRIEVLYLHFPKPIKTCIKWLTLLAAVCFLGALLWKSWTMGMEAWETKEVAMGVFKLPLYPLKLFMPFGAFLFLLGCIVAALEKK